MTESVPLHSGLAALADRYDGFIVDLWGTVHDGYAPLAGAVECLAALKQRDKRILILSNAPRRAHRAIARMTEIGVAPAHYDAVLTSGEAAHLALKARADRWHARLGDRCFLLGPPDDDSVLEDIGLARARSLAKADFILAIGANRRGDTVADYEAFLAEALARRLPMLCANPDHEVLRGPVREICAGAIAARYAAMGGDVREHGKPHAAIYDACLAMLGLGDRRRILAVGDALRTDIAGARDYGLDALLVTGGLHAEALEIADFAPPEPGRLAALCAAAGYWPSAAVPAFRW
jgi:HAD superfamily hydrolase (TIGR01459 family)